MSYFSSDQRPPRPDEDLATAYGRAEYVCNRFVLRIGQAHPAFDDWLADQGYRNYAFLTAHNPRSVLLSPAVNQARHEQLVQLLRELPLPFAPALGRDPAARWPPEAGVLLFDAGAGRVHHLGRAFDQNAVVEGSRGGVPFLVWLREAE